MKHFVPMKHIPGIDQVNVRVGQIIPVFLECECGEIEVPMTVIKTYVNGDFDGEVIWGES